MRMAALAPVSVVTGIAAVTVLFRHFMMVGHKPGTLLEARSVTPRVDAARSLAQAVRERAA